MKWSDIYETSVVYEKDSLFAGENSFAIVKLLNSTAKIKANSLVVISKDFLIVEKGDIEATLEKGAQINLRVNGDMLKIEASDTESKFSLKSSDKSSEISLVKGELKLSKEGKKIELKSDEVLSINENKDISVRRIKTISLNIPLGKQKYLCRNLGKSIKWKKQIGDEAFVVNIADPISNITLLELNLNKSTINVDESLSAFDNQYLEIQVSSLGKQKVLSKSKNQSFFIKTAKPARKVLFNKSSYVVGQEITFEMEKNNKESKSKEYFYVNNKSTRINSKQLRNLLNGIKTNKNLKIYSCYYNQDCQVELCEETAISFREPNVPVIKIEKSKIYLKDLKEQVELNWSFKDEIKVSNLELLVTKNEKKVDLENRLEFKKRKKQVILSSPGLFEFNIVGNDEGVNFISNKQSINVEDSNRIVEASAAFYKLNKDRITYKLVWSFLKKTFFPNLEVKVFNPNKSLFRSFRVKGREQEMELSIPRIDGMRIEIDILDSNSKRVDTFINIPLTIPLCSTNPELSKPIIFYKKLDSEKFSNVQTKNLDNFPFFEWSKVKNAHSYQLNIYPEQNKTKRVLTKLFSRDNRYFVWTEPLKGKYIWDVTALDLVGRPCGKSSLGIYKYLK